MTITFLFLLKSSSTPLLADGAKGTLPHSRGAPFYQCFDELNLGNLAAINGIHTGYLKRR
jgi:hypothetical protein